MKRHAIDLLLDEIAIRIPTVNAAQSSLGASSIYDLASFEDLD